jgi:hypothetical protein
MFSMGDGSIVPKQWHSLCYSFDTTTNRITIVFDGRLLKGSITDFPQFNISLSRMTNSSILYGANSFIPEPHIWNADKRLNRFSGQLSDINIWSKPISFDSLVLFTKECQSTKALGIQPDLLDWSKIDLMNQSTEFVHIEKIHREDSICSKEHGDELKVMHYQSSFSEANHLCNAYGGKIIAPTNVQEWEVINKKIYNEGNIVGYIKDTCSSNVWSGIKKSPNETWVRVYDHVEATFPWKDGQPNGLDLQQCLAGSVHQATLEFMDESCLANYCALCEVPPQLKFMLRGELPELLGVERDFSRHASNHTGKYIDSFQGYITHKIERINDHWALVQVQDLTDKVIATLQSNNVLGLKKWTYKNDSYAMKFSQVSYACGNI